MPETRIDEQSVKNANRRLYDAVAEQYEEIDGRRSPALRAWLRTTLRGLREQTGGERLLDVGAGSGLVTRCAEGIFPVRVGLDLSPRIMALHGEAFDLGIAGDVDRLPFADGSFDVVTCFAVLHHLYRFDGLVEETARVLRPGGIFYSDHDMDRKFRQRFRGPLTVYRRLRNAAAAYREASADVTDELYHLTECQEMGIDVTELSEMLAARGFRVSARFHWFGLTSLTNRLLGARECRRGWAPLAAITAVKAD